MQKPGRGVAIACIALIVCAAILPLGGVTLSWLIVTPTFTLLPPFGFVTATWEPSNGEQRLVALITAADPRGPPPSFSRG